MEIIMPRSLIADIQKSALEIENEKIDMSHVDSAFDDAIDVDIK